MDISCGNEYDEYVRQVVEEDQEAHGSAYDYRNPEESIRQQEDARQAEQARMERERAEQIRLQREAEFEAELARMNVEQQKAARKQKRKDAGIVRRILRAAAKKKHYAVLGLRNWEIKVGRFTLFKLDTKDIRKAYRKTALLVHPDQNRDGRANEAFVAVEESASILSDENMRAQYDDEVRLRRIQRRQQMKTVFAKVYGAFHANVARGFWVFRRIMGPFATPLLILGCLLAP
jgi:hypothetical protein